jgi:hypothetical protein
LDNDWQDHPNLEIKARCCDLLKKKERDKRELTIKASNVYLEVYRLTEEMDYLERAISIRNFKQANSDEFLEIILIEILNKTIQYPFWLANIVKALVKSYSSEKCLQEAKISKTYHTEKQYIDVLFLLKSISKQESYKLKALSFESEAENIWNNQEENTFYPNLPQLYHNAYKEIAEIKSAESEISQCIKKKLIRANTYFAEFLSKVGIRTEIPFGEDEKKD